MKINDQKITREFCERKLLVFFPRTLEEAQFIQRKIFEMGFQWGKGTYDFENGSTTVQVSDHRLLEGLVLDEKGNLFAHPIKKHLQSGLLCDTAQFDEAYLTSQQKMMEQFNKLSARIEEIAKSVARIEKELQPKNLDKPAFKKPDSAP